MKRNFYVFFLLLYFAAVSCAGKHSSITQYGITWTFDRAYEAGRYITGDWWVKGPVTLISVSPPQITGRNGSVLNAAGTISGRNRTQGYDDRAHNYDENLRVSFPLVLQPDNSLISTISHTSEKNETVMKHFELSRSRLKTATVLTCVDRRPPADAFRPPYLGSEKPVFRSGSIRWDLLPGLADIDGKGKAELLKYNRIFKRLWLDHSNNWASRSYFPTDNMPTYGREIGRAVGMAACILMLDIPRKELDSLMIGMIQKGIDYFYMSKNGIHWPADGGHGSGRKLPILLAGIMLDNGDMKKVNQFNTHFGEDDQTYYYDDPDLPAEDKFGNRLRGARGWTGATVLYDITHWGGSRPKYEHVPPEEWYKFEKIPTRSNVGCTAEGYRRCCTSLAWIGQALVLRIMNARQLWDHDAFFDYCDRWMTEEDTPEIKRRLTAACGRMGQASGTVWDDLVKNMWSRYRKMYE